LIFIENLVTVSPEPEKGLCMVDGHEALGVDFGGVIVQRSDENADTSFFTDNYLETPAVAGVFEALGRLVRERFGDEVFVVSKCGFLTRQKMLRWFEYHDFYKRTGIKPSHVETCRTRAEKADICKKLGVTHFVDDRLEVLGHMNTVRHRYLLNWDEKEVEKFHEFLVYVWKMKNWEEAAADILSHPRTA